MPPPKQTRSERRAEFKRDFARELRSNVTEAEGKLWAHLRGRRMANARFRRQQPLGPYVVDFFCSAAKLVIELDGGQHMTDEGIAYDSARTKWLEEHGYRVLRFSNAEFLKHRDAVLDMIWNAVRSSGSPLPEPPSAVRPSLKGRV